MISVRFLPSACRLTRYCLVEASVRIRVVAIRHNALLACRLPPRLRRCRTVRPDDAWTGLTPHSAAKDRSDFHPLGVVAGCDQQRRVGLGAETADLDIELRYLDLEGLVSAG